MYLFSVSTDHCPNKSFAEWLRAQFMLGKPPTNQRLCSFTGGKCLARNTVPMWLIKGLSPKVTSINNYFTLMDKYFCYHYAKVYGKTLVNQSECFYFYNQNDRLHSTFCTFLIYLNQTLKSWTLWCINVVAISPLDLCKFFLMLIDMQQFHEKSKGQRWTPCPTVYDTNNRVCVYIYDSISVYLWLYTIYVCVCICICAYTCIYAFYFMYIM